MNTSHERGPKYKDEWLTPPEIIAALGPFDLDPCAPPIDRRPWPTARIHYDFDGLDFNWFGKVWCNPPYDGTQIEWLLKCLNHGDAIALVFARTDTRWFHTIAPHTDGILLLKNRIRFYHADGKQADRAGTASMLLAFGESNAQLIKSIGEKEPMLQGIYFEAPKMKWT